MKPQKNIAHAFNKFAGSEVQVTETIIQTQYGPDTHLEISPSDTAVADLRKAAASMGLRLRENLPGRMQTMDFRADRLNVSIERSTDGKWRIGSDFRIG